MNYAYFIFYERIHHPGSGFKFPCDSDGLINEAVLTTAQRHNLKLCRDNRWLEFRNPRMVRGNEVNHIL